MSISRDDERRRRAAETPLVGGLPDYPGILVTMMLSPALATPLRTLADVLLVAPFAGSTLNRAERELIATAVSAGNDCFYCMDTHGAFAATLLQQQGLSEQEARTQADAVKNGDWEGLSDKLQALIQIALTVREHGRKLRGADVERALAIGATDQDVQLAVLIAAAFCMYNRMVDGFRARTPANVTAHYARAEQISRYGYSDPRLTAVPATV